MLELLFAISLQGEIANMRVCDVEDPPSLSDDERECVSELASRILGHDPDFLAIEWPESLPILGANPHRCSGRLNHNIEPVWPLNDDGANLDISTPIVISLVFNVDAQGRVRDVAGSSDDTTRPQGVLDEFIATAETAVSRWQYRVCEGRNPAAKGLTTQLHFTMADQRQP